MYVPLIDSTIILILRTKRKSSEAKSIHNNRLFPMSALFVVISLALFTLLFSVFHSLRVDFSSKLCKRLQDESSRYLFSLITAEKGANTSALLYTQSVCSCLKNETSLLLSDQQYCQDECRLNQCTFIEAERTRRALFKCTRVMSEVRMICWERSVDT